MKRGAGICLLVISLISLSSSFAIAAQCSLPYELEDGKCVIPTKEVSRSSEFTIQEQCADNSIPAECCQPPDYDANPACPIGRTEVIGDEPPPRQFKYPESNEIYKLVYECYRDLWEQSGFTVKCWGPNPDIAAGKAWHRIGIAENACKQSCSNDDSCKKDCGHNYALQFTEALDAGEAAWDYWNEKSKKTADSEKKTIPNQNIKAAETPPLDHTQENFAEEPFSIDKWNSMKDQAMYVNYETTDTEGVAITEEQLNKAIGDTPLMLKSRLDNIAKGQPFVQQVPTGALLQQAILTPSERITDGEMTFTLNEKPKSLKIPEPDTNKYEIKSGFSVELKKQGQEIHPLSEAMFYIKQPGGSLLRYEESRRDWTPLESKPTNDGFIARSKGNSHFAIVIDKTAIPPSTKSSNTSTAAGIIVGIAILLFFIIGLVAILAIPAYFIYRAIKRRKTK